MTEEKVAIGCDHAGIELKNSIKRLLLQLGITPLDYGTQDDSSVDYPDYGEKVSRAISSGELKRGILICGTGIGMSIVANKFPGVRATLCHDSDAAKMSRLHNNSNILVIGARTTSMENSDEIVRVWLDTPFDGGRHLRRIEKISMIEKRLNNES
jgi:ribose 5-phosphate isomerase B